MAVASNIWILSALLATVTACSASSFKSDGDKKIDSADVHLNPPAVLGRKPVNQTIDSLDEAGILSPQGLNAHEDYVTAVPGGGGSASDGVDAVIWLPCGADPEAHYAFEGAAGAKVRIAGDFCSEPLASGSLDVIFVVDFSGSMTSPQFHNDPTVNGTCGRLEAMRSMVAEVMRRNGPNTTITLSVVGFSDGASLRLAPSSIAEAAPLLNVTNLCGSDAPSASTNYQAAFEVTNQLLAQLSSTSKAVYFLSDGYPSVARPGEDARIAGVTAAYQMRASHPDTVVNAIFLGIDPQASGSPAAMLQEITGDPQRVRIVANAYDAVEQITEISIPTALDTEARASHQSGDAAATRVNVESFQNTAPGRYSFMTAPIVLSGVADQAVGHRIRIVVPAASGPLQSGAIIDYTLIP